jgi:hypothetical protein
MSKAVTTERARVIELLDTNKAKIAALVPFVLTLIGVVLNGLITGEFNGQELRIAVGGLVTALLTGFGVYQTATESAVVEVPVDPAVEPRSSSVTPEGERKSGAEFSSSKPYDYDRI